MRWIVASLLLLLAGAADAQQYRLPFEGRWFVAQGGDTINVNQHMAVRAQWFAVDFVKAGGPAGRSPFRSDGSTVDDFYGWGAEVLAPVDGEIIEAVDEWPDNAVGVTDRIHLFGNHVILKAADDQYVVIAHLQRGSVMVGQGQRLARGQLIGRCGNSGNSSGPHVHLHVQDSPELNQGTGRNIVFSDIDVEWSGKAFHGVDWPLIRGLFVSNT